MRKRYIFIILFFALVWAPNSYSATAPALMAAMPDIYADKHNSALSKINAYISAHPNDPDGFIMRGIAYDWYALLNNKGKSLNGKIMADFERAKSIAENVLKANPKNDEYQIKYGNALMYIAKKHIDDGKKMKAGNVLKKSSEIMMNVIERNPNIPEAYFAVGMFNYFTDNVPRGFKWLIKLLGFKGDASKGMQYISKAASTPNLTQGDARYMLFYIYSRKQGRYAKAFNQIVQLQNDYPTNLMFIFDLAEMEHRTKRREASRKHFGNFFDHCKLQPGKCSQRELYLSNYFLTWGYMDDKDYGNAKRYIKKAMELNTGKYKDRTRDLEKWNTVLAK